MEGRAQYDRQPAAQMSDQSQEGKAVRVNCLSLRHLTGMAHRLAWLACKLCQQPSSKSWPMYVGQGGRIQSSSAASRRLAGILADWQA